jgi:glutathione S-transferase
MMADLILYGIPQSTYVRSARMACIEKGVPYSLEMAPPHGDAINKLHPFGKVPAMRHGDFTLFETSAIMRYVDDAFDGPRLTPGDVRRRARMEQWISTINAYCDGSMIRRLVLQYAFPSGPDGKPDRAVIDKAAEEVKKEIALIDEAVAEGPFLLGADISLADLLLAPIMYYLSQTPEGGAILKTTRNIPRSGTAISARKSYQETMPPPPPKHD